MKPYSSFLLCLLFSLLLLSSCYKVEVERNDLPQGYSVAQLVGLWKVTGISSDKANDWDGNGTSETNIYSTWPDCLKDNLYQFNSNYTGTYKLSCSDTKTGTWQLDGTVTLVWAPSGSATTYEKIIYLTSDTFKTETNITLPNSETYKITKVWSLQ
jgi:hypothetical protein